MNNIKRLAIPITLIICAIILIIIGSALRNNEPLVLQGTVCCTTYKAASKIAGRIDSLWVKQGDRVEYGAPLYALSTPELDIKLTQANAAKNAAKAIDEQTIAGARKQQIDAAHSLWLKAKTGSDFALKSYQRIARLSQSGVVTAQQLDEARANYEAMQATEQAAFSQYSFSLSKYFPILLSPQINYIFNTLFLQQNEFSSNSICDNKENIHSDYLLSIER